MARFLLRELSRYNIGTYADVIYRNALLFADDPAFLCNDHVLSFSEFNARVNRVVHALHSLGLEKGDVVGILSWNCLEYPLVYGAAMKGGFIASPFNPRLKADELDYIVNYSEAKVIFVGPESTETVARLRPRLPKAEHYISFRGAGPEMSTLEDLVKGRSEEEPDVSVEEEDPLFIFYSSGTTGIPRGALYTHSRAVYDMNRFVFSVRMQRGDKHVQIMPLFHVGGSKMFWSFFYMAASNVIMPQVSFDPAAALQTIQDEKATHVHIVPTHLAAFLALPDVDRYDLSTLKGFLYAASPMPLELLKKGMEKWGLVFFQNYGATETGPNVSSLSARDHDVLDRSPEEQEALASAGIPIIGVQVRIVDEKNSDVAPGEVGEIIVCSKSVMQEWWRKPEETKETLVDGWIHTGDAGRYDEKGHIYIVDRKKDMIISGGENIFPREIEEVLYQHPAVHEAAVIGLPDPYWVERVHAVVVPAEGVQATAEEIIGFCKKRLAGFKAPKSVEFVAVLPKSPAGKILKRELRKRYKEEESQSTSAHGGK